MNDTFMIIFGISFVFLMTTLGAACVYGFKDKISVKWNTVFLGFASGIMLAASVWSLLLPAIEQAETSFGYIAFLPISFAFLLGGLFLPIIEFYILKNKEEKRELKSSSKLFLAVTLHNIPEGLAVGFAFGTAYVIGTYAAYMAALGLAIGIGVQNFPEGAAVSLPIKSEIGDKSKAFLYGLTSGIVEPVFALIGYFTSAFLQGIQPWALAFSAGAMVYVVAEELLPNIAETNNRRLGAISVLLGFIVMMSLDVALG